MYSDEYRTAYADMNEVVRTVANRTGVILFDYASSFTDDKYFTDGGHLSEEGAEQKAKLFAQYILDHNLIPDGN